MVAVEEFELSEGGTPAPAPAAPKPSRGDRPSGWVALALGAVAVGALVAPVTLPRLSADIPAWGGLDRITYLMMDGDVDPLALGRDAVGFFASYDDERRPTGTVVVLLEDVVAPVDATIGGEDAATDAVESVAVEAEFDRELFTALETAAYRSDWVCEPEGDQALCTALADPEITITVPWAAP